MSFTRSVRNVNVHQNMPDYPSSEGYTAAQLKTAFDSSAVGLQADINGLMTELEDTSSASNIGAAALYEGDETDANIQAKIEHLQEEIVDATTGTLPDNSITEAKLVSSYSSTLAVRTNLGQALLASKYTEPSIIAVQPTSWSVPALTEASHDGYSATWRYNSAYSNVPSSVYEMFNGDGTKYMDGGITSDFDNELVLQTEKWTRFISANFKTDHLGDSSTFKIYVSADGTTWNEVSYTKSGNTRTFTSNTNSYYHYIKFLFKGSHDYSYRLYNNIKIYGYTLDSTTNNTMSIAATSVNDNLTGYEEGMVVKIKTPSTYVPGTNLVSTLNIYNLGAKTVPDNLQPSTRYSLVYDGTKFIHE